MIFGFFSAANVEWTVPSDDEDVHFVELILVRLSSRHDQEESQELKTQPPSYARKQTHG